jgi:uncharacterized integral membrane protein
MEAVGYSKILVPIYKLRGVTSQRNINSAVIIFVLIIVIVLILAACTQQKTIARYTSGVMDL